MQQAVFIRLETTLEKAMYYRNSPQMDVYSFRGIQLIPNTIYPYIQRTYSSDGIEIENPTEVYVNNMCDERISPNIADSFDIENVFNDPSTGLPQVDWSLTNVPFDAGDQMIYLEIVQGVDATFYSSPFQLTSYESEYTARWDYKNKENGQMLSVQLRTWFKQLLDFEDITTYDNVSRGRRVAKTSTLIPYELWTTSIIDINLFRTFKQMRRNKWVYCDFQKTIPFEAFETPKLVGRENFAESEFSICRDETNIYDPFYVYIPPTPPVDPPVITIIRVDSVNNKNVSYTFTYAGFEPSYFVYQYSLDGETWTNNTGGIISPTGNIFVNDNLNIDYKYRMYYLPLDLYSNIVTLATPAIVINNITSPQTAFVQIGNNYNIFFSLFGFSDSLALSFEASVDNVSWMPLYYNSGNASPKYVTTPSSGLEFKYFRVKYNPLGIISNTFNFEF